MYKNASLNVKNTPRCPILLDPVLLCHQRNEKTVQSVLDALTEKLRSSLQVIGCDGEKSLMQVAEHLQPPPCLCARIMPKRTLKKS